MERMQNIDFTNPSKELIFELCMGELKTLYEDQRVDLIVIDSEAHRDLLVRYYLQSYSDLFKEYMIGWIARKDSMDKLKEAYDNFYIEKVPYKIKVSKILKMFLSRELNNNTLSVSITDLYDKIDFIDSKVFNQIQSVFIKEFERLRLNETEYTREEALEEIISADDPDWLIEYAPSNCFDGLNVYPDFITEELIENYIYVHYKPREINIELINNVITDLEMSVNEKKEKAGAKIKNLNLGELAKRLSYIHRIDQFLNQNKFKSIKDFPLSNKTCRFIYEYFEFFNLIYGHVKFDVFEKEKRTNYIKSMIRNNENFSKKGIFYDERSYPIIDPYLELKIDLFKKVKDGLLSPVEFHERLNFYQE